MTTTAPAQIDSADDLFDDGMEHWWDGDRRGALKVFRRVLEIDPRHADAHNHLGIASLDARKLKVAEQHFRAAVDGGERHLERDGARVPWGIIENRPYLRGLGNLALVLAEQRRWPEALAVHQQMLRLNPDDNQGVRWLIGVEHLRVGDDKRAIEAFAGAWRRRSVARSGSRSRGFARSALRRTSVSRSSWAWPQTATWR
jgi:tetratricopeptide (TPR) repeat protein